MAAAEWSCWSVGEFERDYLFTESKLKNTLEACKATAAASEDFAGNCFIWAMKTKQIIRALEDIANELDEHKRNINKATVVGSSVGLGGSISRLVGSILLPIAPAASQFFFATGFVASGVGAATNIGSAAVGECLKKSGLDKVRAMLTKHGEDNRLLLQDWTTSSQNLESAFQELMRTETFTLLEVLFKQVCEGVGDFIHYQQSFRKRTKKIYVNSSCFPPAVQCLLSKIASPIELKLVMSIFLDKNLFDMLQRVMEYHAKNPLLFESARLTVQFKVARAELYSLRSTFAACASARKVNVRGRNAIGRAVYHGALATAAIAIDAVALEKAASELEKNSPSEVAVEIRKVAECMKEELDFYLGRCVALTGSRSVQNMNGVFN